MNLTGWSGFPNVCLRILAPDPVVESAPSEYPIPQRAPKKMVTQLHQAGASGRCYHNLAVDLREEHKKEWQLSPSNCLDHPKPKRPPDLARILMMMLKVMRYTADLVGRNVGWRVIVCAVGGGHGECSRHYSADVDMGSMGISVAGKTSLPAKVIGVISLEWDA